MVSMAKEKLETPGESAVPDSILQVEAPIEESDKDFVSTFLNFKPETLNEVLKKLPRDYFFPSAPSVYLRECETKMGLVPSDGKPFEGDQPDPPSWFLAAHLPYSLLSCKDKYYTDNVNVSVPFHLPIKEGDTFDIVSMFKHAGDDFLVRNDGEGTKVGIETLGGKFVLVCCFYVPVLWMDADVRGIAHAFGELSDKSDCEKVVIVQMRDGFADDKGILEQFYSAFSSDCLLVPFNPKTKSSDYYCKCLNFSESMFGGLVVGPQKKVLFDDLSLFTNFGALECYPFTDEAIEAQQDKFCHKEFRSLEHLLSCRMSDVLCNNLDSSKVVSVGELKGKLVGLFLCTSDTPLQLCQSLPSLQLQCREKKLDFEIVLVYNPIMGARLSLPMLQVHIDRVFKKWGISCWVLPFNNSVSRRLWKLSELNPSDSMLIIGPNGKFLEPCGLEVISSFGIDGYPFTRKLIIDNESQRLRGLTLNSLLSLELKDCSSLLRKRPKLPGRNILVYLSPEDGTSSVNSKLYRDLIKWYKNIKQRDSHFEVVFVYFLSGSLKNIPASDLALITKEPWYLCPVPVCHASDVKKYFTLIGNVKLEPLAIFGKNGYLRTINAETLLRSYGPEAFPFDDRSLRRDVVLKLDGRYEFMEGVC